MKKEKKIFKAIAYDKDVERFAKRVTVEAADLAEAIELLNQKYGRDGYIDLHNEADAERPR
jgi:hypothetical protein